MKLFAKIFNGASPLTIFAKSFILMFDRVLNTPLNVLKKSAKFSGEHLWLTVTLPKKESFTVVAIARFCQICQKFFFIKHILETVSTISICSSKENLTYMQNVFTGSNKDMKNRLFWHLYIQLWTVFILWTHKSESIHRIQKIFWTAI